MLKVNVRIFALLYLFAISYCQAADDQDQRSPKRRRFGMNIKGARHVPVVSVAPWSWDDVFEGKKLSDIKRLDFNNKNIEFISDGLNNLPALFYLNLAHNQIKSIPAQLNLPALTHLYLSDNQIESIPDGLDFPVLTNLDLSKNWITRIPSNVYFPQLTHLFLDDNQIVGIDVENFIKQFPNLKLLHIGKNPIEQENLEDLLAAAEKEGRDLNIKAYDIGSQNRNPADATFHFGAGIKKAK